MEVVIRIFLVKKLKTAQMSNGRKNFMCNVKRQKDSGVVADILVDIKKNKWSWTGHEMALSRWVVVCKE